MSWVSWISASSPDPRSGCGLRHRPALCVSLSCLPQKPHRTCHRALATCPGPAPHCAGSLATLPGAGAAWGEPWISTQTDLSCAEVSVSLSVRWEQNLCPAQSCVLPLLTHSPILLGDTSLRGHSRCRPLWANILVADGF